MVSDLETVWKPMHHKHRGYDEAAAQKSQSPHAVPVAVVESVVRHVPYSAQAGSDGVSGSRC
jgi:hypothetical protein